VVFVEGTLVGEIDSDGEVLDWDGVRLGVAEEVEDGEELVEVEGDAVTSKAAGSTSIEVGQQYQQMLPMVSEKLR
jgi:hypothetical protein